MSRTEYLDLVNLLKQVAATQQALMDEQARQRTLIVQIQVEMGANYVGFKGWAEELYQEGKR